MPTITTTYITTFNAAFQSANGAAEYSTITTTHDATEHSTVNSTKHAADNTAIDASI